MIVREKNGLYLIFKQHDHALVSGKFAEHWSPRPRPLDSTLYAIAHHDVAWRGPDSSVRWNEDEDRPYSFLDYPVELKVRAYEEGIDWIEERDPYAACLCSTHYTTLVRDFGGSETETRFVETETRRQERLQSGLDDENLQNLDYNLKLLKLCDGLSLFICLNEPGGSGYPPPYPGGFALEGKKFEPVWDDERTFRLDPNPFSEPFDLSIPYQVIGQDRQHIESNVLRLRVTC